MAKIKPHDQGLFFKDPRDSRSYKVIVQGSRLWTAENLDFYSCDFGSSGIRKNKDYGGYYTWNDVDEACPPGWKVPTVDEWHELYSAWKKQYQDLDFTTFASGNVIEAYGTLPMGGIGRLEDGLYNEATFANANTAAYWAASEDSCCGLKIFCITADGIKTFNPIGNEVCNLRVVKRLDKAAKEDDMS